MKIEKREKWVQINKIQGYEDVRDCYYISNSDEDKIINKNTGKQLKIGLNDKGYKAVYLQTKDGGKKYCYLHILKAKAFLFGPNPLGANVVRHLNDVKTDNKLINLAWGSYSDNMRDCIRNGNFSYENLTKGNAVGGKIGGKINGAKNGKRSSKPVKCIETNIIYLSVCDASRQTGIPQSSISYCCNGKLKTAGEYHWQFVNKQE